MDRQPTFTFDAWRPIRDGVHVCVAQPEGVNIGCVLGTDSFFFGLVPLAMQVGIKFGIDPINMANIMLIGKNYGVLVTPHAATTFLAIGLAGVELKDHLKYCFWWLWALGLISLLMALVMGIVKI